MGAKQGVRLNQSVGVTVVRSGKKLKEPVHCIKCGRLRSLVEKCEFCGDKTCLEVTVG